MRRTSLALAGLALLAVSCGSDAKPKAEPSASATTTGPASESPSATPSPSGDGAVAEVKVGQLFYSDSFGDKSKGWPAKSTANAKYEYHTDYATPLYTVTVVTAGFNLFPHPEFRGVTREQLTDYEVSALVQTTLAVGREDWFGVTCRDLDDKRYSFEMSYPTSGDHESGWVIAKHDAGKLTVLAKGTHTVGGSAFEISGACVGGAGGDAATLVMKVNDEVVGSVEDGDAPLPQGYGGIYLYSKAGRTTVNVLSFAARTAELA